jgi:hypothetical protein
MSKSTTLRSNSIIDSATEIIIRARENPMLYNKGYPSFVHKVRYQNIKGIVERKHLARLVGIHSSLWQLMSTPRQELLLPQSRDRELRSKALPCPSLPDCNNSLCKSISS